MRRVLTSLVESTLARMVLTLALVKRISSSSTRVMRHTLDDSTSKKKLNDVHKNDDLQ